MSEKKAKRNRHLGEVLPKHESHGLISFSRIEGRVSLFGAPVKPLHFIELRISDATRTHGLGGDRFLNDELQVVIQMTEVQFAEFITTPNRGCGVPCTFAYKREGDLKKCEPPPPEETEAGVTRRQFREEVEEVIGDMKEARARVGALLDKTAISQKAKSALLSEIDQLMRLFVDSAPFAMKRFEENVGKVIANARVEMTAHARLVAEQTGVTLLKQGGIEIPVLDAHESEEA